MGRKPKGYGNNDYRFYTTRIILGDGELRTDDWDEVRKFETEDEAHIYWDTTEYSEMHKVELDSEGRWIIQFIKTDPLYETSKDIRIGM